MNVVGALCLLFLVWTGTGPPLSSSASPPSSRRSEIAVLRKRGYALHAEGRIREAATAYRLGFERSVALHDSCSAAWFLNNLAGAHFAFFRYKEALSTYLDEKRYAQKCGDATRLGILLSNISSLYVQMENYENGAQAAEESLRILPARSPYLPQALMNRGRALLGRANLEQAVASFYLAIEEAAKQGHPEKPDEWKQSLRVMVQGWNELGTLYLRHRQWSEAERALGEAYRIQWMSRIQPNPVTYSRLAELRLAQGDLKSAQTLINQAIATALPLRRFSMWRLYYDRGRIHVARKEWDAAEKDLSVSLDLIREERVEFLPADTFRISSEAYLQNVFKAYIFTCNQLYRERNRREYALSSFKASEENRALSLRVLLNAPEDWRNMLSDSYMLHLSQLREAEAAQLESGSPEWTERVQGLQASLTEEEVSAGLRARWFAPTGTSDLLAECQQKLRADEALLSFHLGDRESYLWVVTKETFSLQLLPPRSRIEQQMERFEAVVQNESSESAGLSLFRELFGQVPQGAAAKPRWLLVLDQSMFRLPYAALVAEQVHGRPVYLIERHALQMIPGAAVLSGRPGVKPRGRFVGLGDPVYNTADTRWTGAREPRKSTRYTSFISSIFAWDRSQPGLQLPRLGGSSAEIRNCSRTWSTEERPLLLSGMAATPGELDRAMAEPASVLHLATHFIPVAGSRDAEIALSLSPSGRMQFLGTREIYSRKLSVRTVVMSGCGSGDGTAIPATGLLGLTRAWLAAGAHFVAATLWPTADDTGELFRVFYHELKTLLEEGIDDPEPIALQRAQIACIRSSSWRSRPAYWAAYFLVSKD